MNNDTKNTAVASGDIGRESMEQLKAEKERHKAEMRRELLKSLALAVVGGAASAFAIGMGVSNFWRTGSPHYAAIAIGGGLLLVGHLWYWFDSLMEYRAKGGFDQ